jgi:uncharacterized membrane protein
MTGRRLTLAGRVGLTLTFAFTMVVMPWSDQRVHDLPVYTFDASWFLEGKLPYRDVQFEYPPLAAPALALPGIAGTDETSYRWAFGALMLALGFWMLALVRKLARETGGDERVAVLALVLAPLAMGGLIRNHFDLLPVAMTVAALVLILRGRTVGGFGVLGLAVMTKGFPLVVAPVAIAWLLGRGERREAVRGTLVLVAVVAVLAGAAVALSPSGALDSIRYQTDRPVQVESLPSFGLRALDALGGAHAIPVASYRSDGLASTASGQVVAASAAVGAAALALLVMGAARRRDPRTLVLASLGAVAAFATFGKVLSPQYLVWTLPLAALALAWRRWALGGVLVGATVLTFVEFPSQYLALTEGRAFPLAVVAMRDALLIVAVGLVVWEVVPRRLRRPARGAVLSP